jgi:hypothetical protein
MTAKPTMSDKHRENDWHQKNVLMFSWKMT